MNILVVNWQDRENPAAGGAEIHLHETFGRLVDRGHSVTLLASGWPQAPRRALVDGIEVHRSGGRNTFSLTAPAYHRRHLSAQPFDVVVENLNKVPLFTPFWTEVPVVLLVHHLFGSTAFAEASLPVAGVTWLLERTIPRMFRDIPTIAVSESTKDDLVTRGLAADLIEVIPNGVDIEHYSPGAGSEKCPEPTLLYLGRLKRYKRVDLILHAVALLRDRGVFCRLRIVGKGDHRGELERWTERLALTDRVDFLGFVSEREKVELFRTAWVHLLTSPKEGWGIANLEAAACGTPTVASDSPGLRDSVVDGETGFLVPHGDVEALARRLQLLVADPELCHRMGKAGRDFAERFSWDRTATEVEKVLLQRMASGGAGR